MCDKKAKISLLFKNVVLLSVFKVEIKRKGKVNVCFWI